MGTRARRRVPVGYLVIGVLVALVMGSERWGGPFTFGALQRAGAEATGAESAAAPPPDALTAVEAAGDGPEIHLTFDDGPHPTWTPLILDVLAEHDARATFFPIGTQVEAGTSVLQRAVAFGHRMGNHTWNHDSLVGDEGSRMYRSVQRTQDAIASATGFAPTCLRPPRGEIGPVGRHVADASGLSVKMWTVDTRDWDGASSGAIADAVIEGAADGAVVLLHDGGGDQRRTVQSLDGLLRQLTASGYRFTPIPGC